MRTLLDDYSDKLTSRTLLFLATIAGFCVAFFVLQMLVLTLIIIGLILVGAVELLKAYDDYEDISWASKEYGDY